jgi:FtsZ-interacting cell division protein ZipA
MAKKCDLKKWFVIGLLIVVIFFLFHSFSAMNRVEGYSSQNEGPYRNCSDITNCNSCQDYTTSVDGKCAWCVNKNKCVARSPPQKSDPNFDSKYTDFLYFNSHQDECTSDYKDCGKSSNSSNSSNCNNNTMNPIVKWFLVKQAVTPTTTPTTTTDSTSTTSTTSSTTDPTSTTSTTTTVEPATPTTTDSTSSTVEPATPTS